MKKRGGGITRKSQSNAKWVVLQQYHDEKNIFFLEIMMMMMSVLYQTNLLGWIFSSLEQQSICIHAASRSHIILSRSMPLHAVKLS
jgi:hypothetical protein